MRDNEAISKWMTIDDAHNLYKFFGNYAEINDGLISKLGGKDTDGEYLQSTNTNFTKRNN